MKSIGIFSLELDLHANAVYHATGVRVTKTPINPTQLLELLEKKGRA